MINALGVLLAGFGASLGAISRWGIGLMVSRFIVNVTDDYSYVPELSRHTLTTPAAWFGLPFPWQTFTVNMLGSFGAGFMAAYLPTAQVLADASAAQLYAVASVGFLGGFTIFGTFTVEIGKLIRDNRYAIAIAYVLISVALGLMLGLLGFAFAS